MERLPLKTGRLIDIAFGSFLSDSSLTPDFERLKQFNESNSTEYQKFLSSFLEKPVACQSRKSLPKSPSKSGAIHLNIRRSTELRSINSADASIPRFYPVLGQSTSESIRSLFPPEEFLSIASLGEILSKNLSLPSFFSLPFMILVNPSILKTRKFVLPFLAFLDYVQRNLDRHTLQEKVFKLLTGNSGRNYLIPSDFVPYITPLIRSHPSLRFLSSEASLQTAYTKCIIARIFYSLDHNLRGRISLRDMASSNFCDCLLAVDKASDVSDIPDFFSYEHFYVLFSKFWQIDPEETGQPTLEELSSYDNYRISSSIVKKIVSMLPNERPKGHITFTDFVYFVNAIEDKTTETALRIWFAVCDLDSDGVLSVSEMKRLYAEQKVKMAENGMDPVKFKLVITQILDMIGDKTDAITISSLRKQKSSSTIFNMLVDFKKFSEWESRDPMFEMKLSKTFGGMSQWDVFCQIEYARLSQEAEGGGKK